jgi:hypothetical protein
MAEKQTLKSWTSKQVHKSTDKISNFDKLKAPYIINDYETWGELYDAVGIEAPVDKEKSTSNTSKTPANTGRTLNDISDDLDIAQREAGAAYLSLKAYEPGSPEYQAAKTTYDTSNTKIETLKSEIQYYQRKAENEKIDRDIKKKKDELKRTKDLGEDTTKIDKDLTEFDAKKKENEKVITDLKPKITQGEKPKTTAASAAALGLPTSSLNRPATVAEKVAKDAVTTGQVPPKVPGKIKGKETPALTDAQQREEALAITEGVDFALPETIFNNVESLKLILERYVAEDWTPDKLRKAIRDDVWFRKNSGAIKQRYVQLFNYEDLVKTGQAQGTTQYEQDIAKLERQIADKARTLGSGIASDPEKIKLVARNMYITNQGIDDPMTVDFIAAAIRPVTSTIGGVATQTYSGQALKDYQAIQDIARSNGLRVKDIIPGGMNERQVLEGIATGRLDANRIAQDTRILAQQGQPQYVRDLLSQGYNLDQVFAPYRQTMANLLEINADEIDLNDSTLRSAISDKGDMNIYDFKKTLKKDNRWQYTENAKQEVSDATLKILRDFGLQG